jgi:hypothetical protein
MSIEFFKPVRQRFSPETALVEKALERTIVFPGIDNPRTTLADALNQLAQKYKFRFDIDNRAFKAEELEGVEELKIAKDFPLEGGRMMLSTVLKRILARIPSASPARYVPRDGSIEITTKAAWLRELGLSPDTEGGLVTGRYRNVPIETVLRDLVGDGLLIDVRVKKKARIKVTAQLYHVPAETALELFVDMAGLAVVERPGVCYVTSPENAARLTRRDAPPRRGPKRPPSGPGRRAERCGLHPAPPRQLPLNQALEAVADDGLVTVLLDVRVERKARVKVPGLRWYNVPTETALELLTDMAGLAVVKRDNVYYVTSPANAARLKQQAVPPKDGPKPAPPVGGMARALAPTGR